MDIISSRKGRVIIKALRANPEGLVGEDISRLLEKESLGVSKKTQIKILKELRQMGIVESEERRAGYRLSSNYQNICEQLIAEIRRDLLG